MGVRGAFPRPGPPLAGDPKGQRLSPTGADRRGSQQASELKGAGQAHISTWPGPRERLASGAASPALVLSARRCCQEGPQGPGPAHTLILEALKRQLKCDCQELVTSGR